MRVESSQGRVGPAVAVSAQRDGPVDELAECARDRERGQVPVDLIVNGDDGRETARPDAGHAFDGERAGRVCVAALRHAQAAAELRTHFDGAGHVARGALADANDVRAGRRQPELPVEGRDAGGLRRRDRARLAHLPQRGVREVAIAGLNRLEDREERVAARACGVENRVNRGRLDDAVSGRLASQERRQVDPRRARRRSRAAGLAQCGDGRSNGPVAGPGERADEHGRHANPLPLGRPEPPYPGEEHADGDQEREAAVPVRAPPAHQFLVLPIPLGFEDLLDLAIRLGLRLQVLDAGLFDRRDVARVEVLGDEPDRGRDRHGARGEAEPRPDDREPPRAVHGRTRRASCTSALGPPRRSISNGHDS